MSLRVLGIDAGSSQSALATLDIDAEGRPTLVRWRKIGSGLTEIRHALICDADLVALEEIEGEAYSLFRVPNLVATSRVEGRFEGIALEKGLRLDVMTASAVRGELCRKGNASDAAVAVAVADLLGPEGGNEHLRDAAAVAMVIGWKTIGRRVALSGAAELAIIRQIAEDNQKRSAKAARTRAKNKAAKDAAIGGKGP